VTKRPFRRLLFRYLPAYRGRLVAGVLCVVASRALMVWAPMLLRRALQVLEHGQGPGVASAATRAGWTFLAVSAGAGLFTWAQRLLLIGASRGFERDLKQDLFGHLERLPVAAYDRMRTGDLLSRLTSDVEAVRWIAGPGPMYVASTAVLFPLALAMMLRLSIPVTLVALVPLLGILGVVRVLAPGVMRRSRAVQDRVGDLSARAQESFAGARVVRAYATEGIEIHAFDRQNQALVDETLGLARYRAWMSGAIYGLGGMAELVVLVHGGWLVTKGVLGFGDLGAYMAYVGMLIWPMISVGWVVSAIQRSAAAIQRIDEVFQIEPERSTTTEPPVEPASFRGALRVDGCTFHYPGAERPALADVSLEVHAGETLALVGPVGGGKSTVLQLFTRTYDPPEGTVFLDGYDVTRVPLTILRRAFAVVPQDPFLFSASLAENLAYAVDGPLDPERALGAARTAGLETDLEGFPRGLDTMIGERGVTLSGGQKQRATLARALLRRAPILVLDDALSSVDTHTEARILDRLRTETGRRTVVIVAHRLSTVRDADRIVVLEGGRVVEAGSHEELVGGGGWYARTYANQRLEAELEDLA
jgi:ATP-binding cassette subfamily B protein